MITLRAYKARRELPLIVAATYKDALARADEAGADKLTDQAGAILIWICGEWVCVYPGRGV